MADRKKLSRRSFLRNVTGAALAIGAVGTVTGSAQAQIYTGVTDEDSGTYADRPGYGDAIGTGITDADLADMAGEGVGPGPGGSDDGPNVQTGVTDSDSGHGADPAGGGRGR